MHLFSTIVDVTVEVRLNNSTLIDGGLFVFKENNHNYFNCSLLVRLLNFK